MKRFFLVALVACGCGRNAFFELDVQLPADASHRYAVVAFARGNEDFAATWAGDRTIAVRLGDAPVTQHVSLEATESFDELIEMKVSFCKNESCTEQGDDRAPELGYRFERVFYEGKRTNLTIPTAKAPLCIPGSTGCMVADRSVANVGKCEVEGCRGGSTTNNCVGDKHYCE